MDIMEGNMKKIEEEEQSIPMRVALSYKNVAKEYKKEKIRKKF